MVRRQPTSRCVLNGQRGEGLSEPLTPRHLPGPHPHDQSASRRPPVLTPLRGAFGFLHRSMGGRLVQPAAWVCCTCVVARGPQARPGLLGRGQHGSELAALWALWSRGRFDAAASTVTTFGSVRSEGSAGPAVQGGSMQRHRLCPSSSQCLRGMGGDSWARQEIGPSREGCVCTPHCLQLACPEGGGWVLETQLGLPSLTNLTPNTFLVLQARLLWESEVWFLASCA